MSIGLGEVECGQVGKIFAFCKLPTGHFGALCLETNEAEQISTAYSRQSSDYAEMRRICLV